MELPDIELAKRTLASTDIYHSSIKKAVVHDKKVASKFPSQKVKGRKIKKVHRYGKYLIMELDRGSILFHCGMTGKFAVYSEKKKLKHVVLELQFSNGTYFFFQNPRKFGRCLYTEDWHEELNDLGLDPLSRQYTFKNFQKVFADHKGTLKPFLQKQENIAGLGNIYIDESLWEAKFHPSIKIEDLEKKDLRRLYHAISKICQYAIKKLKPPVATSSHEIGSQPDFLKAYGREGKTCKRCHKEKIRKKYIGQRVTYYCPNCQKR